MAFFCELVATSEFATDTMLRSCHPSKRRLAELRSSFHKFFRERRRWRRLIQTTPASSAAAIDDLEKYDSATDDLELALEASNFALA